MPLQRTTAQYQRDGDMASYPQNRYNLPDGQLAQLASCRSFGSSLLARRILRATDLIVRSAYAISLAVLFWSRQMELVLGLIVIGQFGEAVREFAKPRK